LNLAAAMVAWQAVDRPTVLGPDHQNCGGGQEGKSRDVAVKARAAAICLRTPAARCYAERRAAEQKYAGEGLRNRYNPAMATLTGAVLKYPARISFAWYAGMIFVGTAALSSPWSRVHDRPSISVLDAAFTATSAACVTGLSVRSIVNDFSLFGQAVILLLIQLGGIGILTVTTFVTFRLGARQSLRTRAVVSQTLGASETTNLGRLLRNVILTTLAIESVGFLLLAMGNLFSMSPGEALWHATFHSISAFCNAGFALHDDSLVRYQGDLLVNLTIMTLILLGGIGYPVIVDILHNRRKVLRRLWDDLHLHSKIMILGSMALTLLGTVVFLVLEWDNSLREMWLGKRLLVSLFQSVTCRTAGFNTVDLAALTNATLLVMMLLMAIGAGPCSTGGGMKVSTVMVLLFRAWSSFQGHDHANVFRRTIPAKVLAEATTTVLLFAVMIVVALTALLVFDQARVPHHASQGSYLESQFEVVSALGTVGLSMGITPDLSPMGRVIIIVVMFFGRLGPISVFIAISRSERHQPLEFARESPLVG
jgi:trk system potassium uptake protein TrkH